MLHKLFNLFKQPTKTIVDPTLCEMEAKKDTWKVNVVLPQVDYTIPCYIYFDGDEPRHDQKSIVLYFKSNIAHVLDSSAKMIAKESDLSDFLEDMQLNKNTLLKHFKIAYMSVSQSNSKMVGWEVCFEPISFDSGGHVFNVIFIDKKCEGLAIDG